MCWARLRRREAAADHPTPTSAADVHSDMAVPEAAPKDRCLSSDDPALRPGWRLVEFLLAAGADEFAVRFLYAGDAKEKCDRLAAKLAFAALGERTRECTVSSGPE